MSFRNVDCSGHRTRPSSTGKVIGCFVNSLPVATELTDRSRRKREAILEVATELFLTRGYAGTSMDEVAAAAGVSKQTVYKHFGGKESLFRAIALSTVQEVSGPVRARIAAMGEADDVESALRDLARSYLAAVVQPEVLRRRQLVIREAGRFPDVALTYHEGRRGRRSPRWPRRSPGWPSGVNWSSASRPGRPRTSPSSWSGSRWTRRCFAARRLAGGPAS